MIERGLFEQVRLVRGKRLLKCQDCPKTIDNPDIDCCCHRLLSVQLDFAAGGQEWLEEVITKAGHKIIFFPKYHCELNYIEMIWAFIKDKIRANCSNSLESMHEMLIELLQSIPLNYVRKVERRCFRFIHGYQLNMSGPMLDYAMKPYTTRRMFPSEFVVREFDVAYAKYTAEQKEADKVERKYIDGMN